MSEFRETIPSNENPRRRTIPNWLGFMLLAFGIMLLALQGVVGLVETLVESRPDHVEVRIESDMEQFELDMEEFDREMEILAKELERALELEETELERAADMAEFEAERLAEEAEREAERIERQMEREAERLEREMERVEREAERFADRHPRHIFWPFRAATACLAPLGLMLLGGYLISKNRRKAKAANGEPEVGFEPIEPRGSDNGDNPPAE